MNKNMRKREAAKQIKTTLLAKGCPWM